MSQPVHLHPLCSFFLPFLLIGGWAQIEGVAIEQSVMDLPWSHLMSSRPGSKILSEIHVNGLEKYVIDLRLLVLMSWEMLVCLSYLLGQVIH